MLTSVLNFYLYLKKITFVMMINASIVWKMFTLTKKKSVKSVTLPAKCVQINMFVQNAMEMMYFIIITV